MSKSELANCLMGALDSSLKNESVVVNESMFGAVCQDLFVRM